MKQLDDTPRPLPATLTRTVLTRTVLTRTVLTTTVLTRSPGPTVGIAGSVRGGG